MIYVKSREQISAISDLNNRRIAILNGSIQEKIFEQMVNGLEFHVTLIKADSYEEAFLLVAGARLMRLLQTIFTAILFIINTGSKRHLSFLTRFHYILPRHPEQITIC